ncbi:MAG TPA: signal peptidase I [Nitrospirota bacterium]
MREKPKEKSVFREYAEAIIIAAVLALFIRTFIVQAFKIPSGSMEDTLLIGDHLIVNKFLYGTKIPFTGKEILPLRDPVRGDVIVFKFPEDETKDFIKRIIGLPGDTLEIVNKKLFVNGKPLTEPYTVFKDEQILPRSMQARDNFGPIKVPEGQYFCMGDNRDKSHDSRFWGFVTKDKIIGKAVIIYWSWDGDDHWVRWQRMGKLVH